MEHIERKGGDTTVKKGKGGTKAPPKKSFGSRTDYAKKGKKHKGLG